MEKDRIKSKSPLRYFFAALVGFINGFFGGGGGLLCVPTLKRIYGLDTKRAHATTIAVILPISIVSSIIYITNNTLNYLVVACITAGVIVGGLIGAIFLKRANVAVIRWIFIIVLFSAGIRMVI